MRKLFSWRTGLLSGALVALLNFVPPYAAARVVWIDTDLSIGSPLREVDDAYALLLAFRSSELEIAGLSTTYGNAPLRATTQRTRDLLDRLGLTMAVSAGATSAADLGRPTAASRALATAVRKNNRLTYIALGPLTNLATFLRLHPEEAKRFGQVIMVAGRSPEATLGFGPGEKFRIHDANLVKDPAAVRAILHSQIPILLTPIETSSRLLLDKSDLRALSGSGSNDRFLARKSGVWLWFWTNIARARGGPIFDALAVVAAARPSLLTIEKRQAAINAEGELIISPLPDEAGRTVSFCSAFSPATKDFVLRRLREER